MEREGRGVQREGGGEGGREGGREGERDLSVIFFGSGQGIRAHGGNQTAHCSVELCAILRTADARDDS